MADDPTPAPEIPGWNDPQPLPPWASGEVMPETRMYHESELFVAGALSTMEPFAKYHPAWALPFARCALDALGAWEPTDG